MQLQVAKDDVGDLLENEATASQTYLSMSNIDVKL